MKKHIQIKDSYKIWKKSTMTSSILLELGKCPDMEWFKGIHGDLLIVEWWVHNIGYYLTKPFVFIPFFKALNLRFKDVDLMVKVESEDTE